MALNGYLPGEQNVMDNISGLNNQYMTNPGASLWDQFSSFMGPSKATTVAGFDPITGKSSGFWDNLMGKTDPKTGVGTEGWGRLGLDTAAALGSGWMAMKQYGLAKDQLKFSKDSFNKNYAAQRTLTNSNLEDRQNARNASNRTGYESTATYMPKNGVI